MAEEPAIGRHTQAGDMGRLTGVKAKEPRQNIARDESSGTDPEKVVAGAKAAGAFFVNEVMFGPETKALARQGREDLLNTLWGNNLTREPGAPGEPTTYQTTNELEGNSLFGNEHLPNKSREHERSR